MKDFLSSLLDLWKQLGINQRVSLGLAALVIAGISLGLVLWSQRSEYRLLFGGLSEKDTAAIVSQLQGQGIAYRLEGGSVYVPADQVHRQRMDLAGKGIPAGEGVGFEIFDKGQFGLSDFVQRTNYLRALQGELARTISQLNGVAGARVMIVQPENRLLLTDQGVKSTASVFVELNRARLEDEAVNSIRHFVANAVQGLALDDVAVIDQKGRVLSDDLREDPMLGTALSQMRYRQQVESYLSKKVESMLFPVIGHGNAVVRVAVDIATESVVQTEERFDPEGQVLRSESIVENLTNSSETRHNATVGVTGNTPEGAGNDEGGPVAVNSERRENRTLNYEINRTLTNTTRNPGTIQEVRAAVFVAQRPAAEGAPQPRTPEEIEGLRQIVINALGLQGEAAAERVTIREAVFHTNAPIGNPEALPTGVHWEKYLELAIRYSGIAVALVILLVFVRLMKRQKPEAIPIEILREAETPRSGNNGREPRSEFTPEMLNEMIRRQPANVSSTLREWVSTNQSN